MMLFWVLTPCRLVGWFSALKMETLCFFETLASTYESTRRQYRDEHIKFHIITQQWAYSCDYIHNCHCVTVCRKSIKQYALCAVTCESKSMTAHVTKINGCSSLCSVWHLVQVKNTKNQERTNESGMWVSEHTWNNHTHCAIILVQVLVSFCCVTSE
jgi:hypothetical protein